MPQLREKPRLGFSSKNPALHQGHEVCNSTTALGLQAALHLERIRSRYTQKERDNESGNDYFFARYYNSAIGRFTTPDWSAKTDPVPYAVFDDPQSLNLYSYVRNNPIIGIDLYGHCKEGEVACFALQAIHDKEGLSQKDVDQLASKKAQQQTATQSGGAPTAATPGTALNGAQLQAVKNAANNLAAACTNAFFGVIGQSFSLTKFDSEMQNATYNQWPTPYSGPSHGGGTEANTVITGPISGRSTNLFADFFVDTPQRQAAVFVHENIHRYTGWTDDQVFSRFAGRGLTHNDHYQTDEITQWVLRGCQ
jgi:RHS repeat-associated protein